MLQVAGLGGYTIAPARVIAIGPAQSFSRTVTIDAGTADGVRADMTVLNGDGLVGRVVETDPLTSIVNAMQYHPADEIIISTFPGATFNWLRGDLIARVRRATGKPVEHVVADRPAAGTPTAVGAGA